MPSFGTIAVATAKWAVATIDKDDVLRFVHHTSTRVAENSKNPTIARLAGTVAALSNREAGPAGRLSPGEDGTP